MFGAHGLQTVCDGQHAQPTGLPSGFSENGLPPIPLNYRHVHSLYPLKNGHVGEPFGCVRVVQAKKASTNDQPWRKIPDFFQTNPRECFPEQPIPWFHLGHEHGPLHHRICAKIHPKGLTEGSANVGANIFLRSGSTRISWAWAAEIKGIWVSFRPRVAGFLDCLIFLGGWSDESCMNRAPCIMDIPMSPVTGV